MVSLPLPEALDGRVFAGKLLVPRVDGEPGKRARGPAVEMQDERLPVSGIFDISADFQFVFQRLLIACKIRGAFGAGHAVMMQEASFGGDPLSGAEIARVFQCEFPGPGGDSSGSCEFGTRCAEVRGVQPSGNRLRFPDFIFRQFKHAVLLPVVKSVTLLFSGESRRASRFRRRRLCPQRGRPRSAWASSSRSGP